MFRHNSWDESDTYMLRVCSWVCFRASCVITHGVVFVITLPDYSETGIDRYLDMLSLKERQHHSTELKSLSKKRKRRKNPLKEKSKKQRQKAEIATDIENGTTTSLLSKEERRKKWKEARMSMRAARRGGLEIGFDQFDSESNEDDQDLCNLIHPPSHDGVDELDSYSDCDDDNDEDFGHSVGVHDDINYGSFLYMYDIDTDQDNLVDTYLDNYHNDDGYSFSEGDDDEYY